MGIARKNKFLGLYRKSENPPQKNNFFKKFFNQGALPPRPPPRPLPPYTIPALGGVGFYPRPPQGHYE